MNQLATTFLLTAKKQTESLYQGAEGQVLARAACLQRQDITAEMVSEPVMMGCSPFLLFVSRMTTGVFFGGKVSTPSSTLAEIWSMTMSSGST